MRELKGIGAPGGGDDQGRGRGRRGRLRRPGVDSKRIGQDVGNTATLDTRAGAHPAPCQPLDRTLFFEDRPVAANALTGSMDRPSLIKTPAVIMAPTVVRDGPFRLFFFSREEPRMHVHVAHPDGEAKFWLEPTIALATHTGLSAKELAEAERVVARHIKEITDAWNKHFGR
ncbi:DUF4160 domain-containing protein [Plasticicumulans lactativorans]